MTLPTGGRFIHFLNGLRVRRTNNIENPIEVQDRAQGEREKKIMLEELLHQMQNQPGSNITMSTN